MTLELFPLTVEGLGGVLAATRRAALAWARLLEGSDALELYQQPDLDIVTYFATPPRAARPSMSSIDRTTKEIFDVAMADRDDPLFLSMLRVDAGEMGRRHAGLDADIPSLRLLRSVLMKPEQESWVPRLHGKLEELAISAART